MVIKQRPTGSKISVEYSQQNIKDRWASEHTLVTTENNQWVLGRRVDVILAWKHKTIY